MNEAKNTDAHARLHGHLYPSQQTVEEILGKSPASQEDRYAILVNALTDVLTDLRKELNGIHRELQRLQAPTSPAESQEDGGPAPTRDGKERAHRGFGAEKKPWKSVQDQLGQERYHLWVRAGKRLREIKEKYGLSYGQIRRLTNGDPVWTAFAAGPQQAPSVSGLSALARGDAWFDKKRGLYVVSLGGRTTLLKILTALDNLDMRLSSMTGAVTPHTTSDNGDGNDADE